MEKRIVIRYIRDEQKRPYGVIVGMPNGDLGCSLCNKGDKWDRDYGKELAIGRAVLNKRTKVGEYRKDLPEIEFAFGKVCLAMDQPFVGLDQIIEVTHTQHRKAVGA